MDQLYGWYVSSYAGDMLEHMRNSERTRFPVNLSGDRLLCRESLVTWIRREAEKQQLSTTAVHLAVYLLDVFASGDGFPTCESLPYARACLRIAAKNENDEYVHEPIDDDDNDCADVNANLNFGRPAREKLADREISILEFLNWRIDWPTVARFAEHHKIVAQVAPTDKGPEETSRRELGAHVRSEIDRLLDLTLANEFANCRPSMTAAACLLAARTLCLVEPAWPAVLRCWTGYKRQDLETVAEKLLKMCRTAEIE